MTATPTNDFRLDNRTDPIVLQQYIEANEARFSLQIPDNLVYFSGHFPGHPILPGVVQTQWVMNLAGRLPLPDSFLNHFSAITRLKFMRLMTPGDQLTLQLRASSSGKSLSFRFFDNQGDYSSGQLNFK